MKRKFLKLLFFAVSMGIMIIVTLGFRFSVQPLPVLNASKNTDLDGKATNGILIEDLAKLQIITDVLYTPDAYVSPNAPSGEPVTLSDKSELAQRGSIQFVFFNLDPNDPDFLNKQQRLAPYLEGDKSWHFSFYLPAVFSACNIYVNSVLEMRIGELANYSFPEYGDYTGETEKHVSKTQPVYLDLSFYSLRRGISANMANRAKIVTIHYESSNDFVSALTDMPLVGGLDEVTQAVSQNSNTLVAVFIVSALVAVILAFNCFLKRSLLPLPQLFSTLGIGGVMLGKFLLFSVRSFPSLWLSVVTASAWIIILATTADVRVKIGKFPVWVLPNALAALGLFLNICMPLFPLPPYALPHLLRIFIIILGVALFLESLLAVFSSTADSPKSTPAVIMICACMAFFPYSMPVIGAPQTWLLIALLTVTAITQFAFFVDLERRNRSLTNNLQGEVTRQTQYLQSMLDDRDKILRYLSHDLRKPVSSIRRYLTDLKQQTARGSTTYSKLEIVERKAADVEDSLRDIAVFSRRTFSTEEPSVLDVNEILQKQYALLAPDCEANNILLHVSQCTVAAFAKRDTLISVINNLIFNAIEHADCKNIYLNAVYSHGACKIFVSDDGKGMQEEDKLFEAYQSENPEGENFGLGLYLCKQHLNEMGGELNYQRKNGKSIFTVTLPIA